MTDKKKYDVEFWGTVYVRPCGRGLTIESSAMNQTLGGWDLADIFKDGHTYEISIKAKEIKGGD